MSIVDQLRSFRRRRITIPADASAIVLDVGSGDKPHWRADVLLDRFIDDTHGARHPQRSTIRGKWAAPWLSNSPRRVRPSSPVPADGWVEDWCTAFSTTQRVAM